MNAAQAATGEFLQALNQAVTRSAGLASALAEREERIVTLTAQVEKQAAELAELKAPKAKKPKAAKPAAKLEAVG